MIAALSDGSDTRELSQQLLAANSTSSGSSCEASFHLMTLLLHVDMPHVGASASAIPDKSPLALLKSPSPAPLPLSMHDKSPRSVFYFTDCCLALLFLEQKHRHVMQGERRCGQQSAQFSELHLL